ncbi:nonsense-mediated mRNA decay factor SMG7-like [Malania oleifera]|uniref:nonsense-mediated mRNA decay factor SMG7-like n=1 Tax=Malania oleifera TaxID=397392 RepID=UPI0025AE732E|nr:nonsense-mediated mRNA decay factor SMG7-like [Malania oleifera]XP_057948635.1 nonsense-mediated mRNA decay factor SMG7-like [Malania oleifera]
MNTDGFVRLDGHKELWVEVVNAEKQLWALLHSKGLLHPDVQDLYHKTRTVYEKIILDDHQIRKLNDVEYSLWKLHYKHIDEFRRRLRQSSANAENTKSAMPHETINAQNRNDNLLERFKSFLLEAMEFYQDLITKIRGRYGLPEGPLFHENGGISSSVEMSKLLEYQFSCHRFLVCLGDLARYKELYEKPDIQNCNWSVAATYYLKATRIWPDSGNPQNQLALLATYLGDEFLALYHCIRSVAVKEPFPDAWDNLSLLLEKNQSSHFSSLSTEADFNFLKPSERSNMQSKSKIADGLPNCSVLKPSESVHSSETKSWSLIVRMINFFFLKSRLEDFPCIFASTMEELEALMTQDDIKLKDNLECYQHMDSTRAGPFRALQFVSILIFVTENLMERPELKEATDNRDIQQPVLMKWGLAATFICMGRLVDRCLISNPACSCPLLPAVLVFVEWLVGRLYKVETYGTNGESTSAMSYFFGSFSDFLNQFDDIKDEVSFPDCTALWEDYELQGFEPLAPAHKALDFLAHLGCGNSYESGNVSRTHRIIHAAKKIVNRSNNSQKWILYDITGRKFYVPESNKFPGRRESEAVESSSNLKVIETNKLTSGGMKKSEKQIHGEDQINSCLNGQSVAMEEEEVILFKPITRYNSEPICTSISTNDQKSPEGIGNQIPPSEECLRRASSLLSAQNPTRIDPLTSTSVTNFRCIKPLQQEPVPKDSAASLFLERPVLTGPPSLNAWVLDRGSLIADRVKGTSELRKHGSNPVEDASSSSLSGLSISETEDIVFDSGHISASTPYSSPPYSVPLPSAPLLPDDAVWFSGDSSSFPQCNSSVGMSETDMFVNASHLNGYSNWSAAHGPLGFGTGIPGFIDGYPPPLIGMTNNFERFQHYKNDQNLEWSNNVMWPVHFNTAGGNLGNFQNQDASRFGLFDRWGNPLAPNSMVYLENPPVHPGFPLVYGAGEEKREKLFHGYQKQSPYVSGAVTELKAEQQPLLQYLKEREWGLQREAQLRGPTA